MPAHPTFFVKRKKYNSLGDFNTSFKYREDYELMFRFFVKHQISSYHLDAVLVIIRVGAQSNLSLRNRLKASKEGY